jgi:gluconolactonase
VDDLYTECDGHRLNGPNDIVFDDGGGFYFTDLGKRRPRDSDTGAVYYAKADGSEIREVVFPMVTPNGVGLSPARDVLYVAETTTARLYGYELVSRGTVTPTATDFLRAGESLLYNMPGWRFFDSMAVEENGNICIALPRSGSVAVISPAGELVELVEIPADDPMATNICFGGADRRTAYITLSGRGLLYEMEWPRPGLPLAEPGGFEGD